jgi:pimeloyl-ACP methyl ester carboxylesterase
VLVHGFPASSFMFRDVIPVLAGRYHVIAPDHLGFGYPARRSPESSPKPSTPLAGLTTARWASAA